MKHIYSINEFFDKNEYNSEAATTFLLKVKKDTPDLYLKMKTILASRGLEKAKEAYSKFESPSNVVSKEILSEEDLLAEIKKYLKSDKNPLVYFKSLVEKDTKSKTVYYKFVNFPPKIKKMAVQKLVIADLTGKPRTYLTEDEIGTTYNENIQVRMFLNLDNSSGVLKINPYFKFNLFINNTSMKFSKIKQDELEKIVSFLTSEDFDEQKLYGCAVKVSRLIELLNKS